MKSFTAHTVQSDQSGLSIEQYVKQILHLSGRKIQKLTRIKGILVNNKPAFLQKRLKAGDIVKVRILEDKTYGVAPEKGAVDILYEDEFLLVANKPPRQLVHPSGQTSSGTLANFLAWQFKERGIVSTIRPLHRLDRDTSGCVLIAKNAESQAQLEKQLQNNILKRTYWALVKGPISSCSGTIDAPIGTHPRLPNRRAVRIDGDNAVTHFCILSQYQDVSLLELTLETGRTHQIRLHLAHIGCPILGDAMYGIRSPLINRQALHAKSIQFTHPVEGRRITVAAPLPYDLSQAILTSGLNLPQEAANIPENHLEQI